jgi:hypothetical protein
MDSAKWDGAQVGALRQALNYTSSWEHMRAWARLVGVGERTVYRWEKTGARWPRHKERLDQLQRTLELGGNGSGPGAPPFRLTRRPARKRSPRPLPAGVYG